MRVLQFKESDVCTEWLFMQMVVLKEDKRETKIRKCEAELKGLSRQINELTIKNNKESNIEQKKVTYYDYLKEFHIITEKRYVSLKDPYSTYIVAQNLFYDEMESSRKQLELQKNGRTGNH